MNTQEILKTKGNKAITIHADELVATAVNALTSHNIGALVVVDDEDAVVGIIDERDIVRELSTKGAQTLRQEVSDVMKTQVLTCTPEDNVKKLMDTMTSRRVRHLPVMRDGTLLGIVSIGDLLKSRLKEMETEHSILRERLIAHG